MPPKRNKNKRLDDFVYEDESRRSSVGDVVFNRSGRDSNPFNGLEATLSQLATGIAKLQVTVDKLAADKADVNIDQELREIVRDKPLLNPNPSGHDRSYISNFKELGGNNVFFYPNGKCHPMAFIKKIKRIFSEAGVPEEFKLGLVLSALRGTAADWADIKESGFFTFQDFEKAFCDKFWGVDRQRELFLKLNYGKYEKGSRSEYFLNLCNQAGYLSVPIEEIQLVKLLSKHFASDVQRGIVTLGLKKFDEVDEYLTSIDLTCGDDTPEPPTEQGVNRSGRGVQTSSSNTHAHRNRNDGQEWRQGRQTDNREVREMRVTSFNEDLDLFSDFEEEEIEISESTCDLRAAFIDAQVGSIDVQILIDSGSEISAISEEFYNRVVKQLGVPLLPVTNVAIQVAVGGKRQRVKFQILLPVLLKKSGVLLDVKCLIVPGLNQNAIFGFDWLLQHKVEMDFHKSVMVVKLADREIIIRYAAVSGDEEKADQLCVSFAAVGSEGTGSMMEVSKQGYSMTDKELVVGRADTSVENRGALIKLLNRYDGVFSESPGKVKSYVHVIEMVDDSPFFCRNYPVAFAHREAVREQIKEMLNWGVIKKQKTDHISPLVTVMKKDGSVRVCLDARNLNKRMKQDFILPPNPNELLASFKAGMVVSTIDLTASYWQIAIKPEHSQYVGFVFENESYTFQRLPFGLSTSMASLIRCLNGVLGPESREFTAVYVDDLLVFSKTPDEHLNHLRFIFEKLESEGVTVKLRKCQFMRKEVTFLGHVISSEGISLDPKRIEAIQGFPTPRNIRELRGFLGLVNYEQRFCEKYSELTIPLLRLLKKNVPWTWGSDEMKAFKEVKEGFLQVSMVAHPDFSKKFFIQCDSSDFAVGGCLFQESDKGERQVVAFTSATQKGPQLRYTTTEKELLALVHCLRQWRTLVLGQSLVVITDHKSLCFLFSCKLKSSRLTRWILAIQEFNFEILHCPGSQNITADTLSRNPRERSLHCGPDRSTGISIMLLRLTDDYKGLQKSFKSLKADQMDDEWIRKKMEILDGSDKRDSILTKRVLTWFKIHEGILFKRGDDLNLGYKICVPKSQVKDLILAHHVNEGHYGRAKTFSYLKQRFYWPKMQKQVGQVVASCEICQKAKVQNRSAGLRNAVLPAKPGELVCIDLMGPLPMSRGGATQLLVLVDAFSKFCKLYALKKASSKAIVNRVLEHYVPQVQKPQCILSDNGAQFAGKHWLDSLSKNGIAVKHTSVYFPQGNMTERYNREIGRLLRSYCFDKHTRWAFVIGFIEECLNNAINETTGFAPYFLQFGRRAAQPIERFINFPPDENLNIDRSKILCLARNRLITKAERRADKHNLGVKEVTFKVGDKVLVRSHELSSAADRTIKKFFLLFEGPFQILRCAGPNSYVIGDLKGKEINKQNVVNLRLFKEPVDCLC